MTIETVKEINGLKIQRYAGTRGAYFVSVKEGKGWEAFHTFRSIKAASEFIRRVYPGGKKSNPRPLIIGEKRYF